ncbi:MAG: glycerophosphodiester phosphodiesterase [Bacillus sp. (in: firmicutes)]
MMYFILAALFAAMALFLAIKQNWHKQTNQAPCQEYKKPWIVAHRGASGTCPENTLAAFRKAINCGADLIELDVRLTKDGQLAVIHDATLERTTNGQGNVIDFTMEELQVFDAGSWKGDGFQGEKIPSLQEVLNAFGKQIGFLIEVKPSNNYSLVAQRLKETIEALPVTRKSLIVQSFDENFLKLFHQVMPDIPIGVLIRHQPRGINEKQIERLSSYASFINPKITLADARLIQLIRKHGADCMFWTVATKKQAAAMLKLSPSAIATDYPEWFK